VHGMMAAMRSTDYDALTVTVLHGRLTLTVDVQTTLMSIISSASNSQHVPDCGEQIFDFTVRSYSAVLATDPQLRVHNYFVCFDLCQSVDVQ